MPEPTPGKRTLEYTETVGEVSRTVIAEVDDMGCILITTELFHDMVTQLGYVLKE